MSADPILNFHRERLDKAVNLIKALVDIESPSNDAARSTEVVDAVVELFTAAGVRNFERIPAPGIGEHLVISAFEGEGKHFLLLGHTDTVHPVGSTSRNPTRIEDGKLYGCGTFDMKANIVLMAEAIRYFNETGTRPKRPVRILLSCDEEVGSHSGREHVEREAANAAACFVCEPSAAGRVKTGRKGTGMYTVRTHGVPSHAGLDPEKGASAVLELARQIERLHALNDGEAGTTVNVCTIRGGTTSNVIPEHAECSVDVRFTTLAEAERVDAAINAISPIDKRVSIQIEGGINRPPMERTDAVVALFEKARAAAAEFGYELGETQVGGASDGNFVAALGVPLLDGLGLAGDGAHTLHEHILLSDIATRATLITKLLNS